MYRRLLFAVLTRCLVLYDDDAREHGLATVVKGRPTLTVQGEVPQCPVPD
jgi:hypothetical protein